VNGSRKQEVGSRKWGVGSGEERVGRWLNFNLAFLFKISNTPITITNNYLISADIYMRNDFCLYLKKGGK